MSEGERERERESGRDINNINNNVGTRSLIFLLRYR